MTPKKFLTLHRRHFSTITKLVDDMDRIKMPPEEGEAIFLYLAGLSAGARQAPCNESDWLAPIAIGWGFAVEMGGE